mmetsp:Transcript_83224/g.269408  ORF Transcript_83224/g.269408 Transcript_83224/m.269408 type:complete len:267 (+) Transcript_83224:33-833(+)
MSWRPLGDASRSSRRDVMSMQLAARAKRGWRSLCRSQLVPLRHVARRDDALHVAQHILSFPLGLVPSLQSLLVLHLQPLQQRLVLLVGIVRGLPLGGDGSSELLRGLFEQPMQQLLSGFVAEAQVGGAACLPQLLRDKVRQALVAAVALVLHHVRGVAVHQCREAINVELVALARANAGAVDFSNQKALVVSMILLQLNPIVRHLFAVPAPWREELHEDRLAGNSAVPRLLCHRHGSRPLAPVQAQQQRQCHRQRRAESQRPCRHG